jgi:hypothetical protein
MATAITPCPFAVCGHDGRSIVGCSYPRFSRAVRIIVTILGSVPAMFLLINNRFLPNLSAAYAAVDLTFVTVCIVLAAVWLLTVIVTVRSHEHQLIGYAVLGASGPSSLLVVFSGVEALL